MASTAARTDFVSLVAQEIAFGIDHALDYWLGRIELELVDAKLTTIERIRAIEQILREYKDATGKAQPGLNNVMQNCHFRFARVRRS